MKKGILIGICLALCLGAVPQRYWQDVVPKCSQQWLNAYGYNPDAVLAYSAWKHEQEIKVLNNRLVALEARVKNLEPTDPNDQ
ncbi:MAG TPA: hypothetical protein HPP87_07180 [Planctomycetes bacterium]|nr:hypothetical protein [Planctomycetota bacterium]